LDPKRATQERAFPLTFQPGDCAPLRQGLIFTLYLKRCQVPKRFFIKEIRNKTISAAGTKKGMKAAGLHPFDNTLSE
jgi:hypothetical protein